MEERQVIVICVGENIFKIHPFKFLSQGWLAGPGGMSCLGQCWPSWHLLPHHTAPSCSHQVNLLSINTIAIDMLYLICSVCSWWHF